MTGSPGSGSAAATTRSGKLSRRRSPGPLSVPPVPSPATSTSTRAEASAASIIAFAIRSLIEPVGFWPSSFAYSRTDGFGVRRGSSTSGVPPTRSRTLGAVALAATAGHGRKQDDGIGRRDGGLVAVARPDVLAADVDVRELELAAERREARREVVEDVADRLSLGQDLALAARVLAKGGGNPDDAHACCTPAQNST